MDRSRYCQECGTLNEAEYKYCKNCGAALSQSAEYDDAPRATEHAYTDGSIGGISVQDMACFVGKNGDKIARKWQEMSFSGHNFSWCWPAFLFSFFFGIAGAGFWFLYRRMYKLGAIILAAAFTVSAAGILIHSESITGFIIDSADCFEQSIDRDTGFIDQEELSYRLDVLINSENARRIENYSDVTELIGIAAAVLAGLFSLALYKKFAVSKIKSYSRTLSPMELMLAGGTSGGGLALGMLLYFIAEMTLLIFVIMGALA